MRVRVLAAEITSPARSIFHSTLGFLKQPSVILVSLSRSTRLYVNWQRVGNAA